MADITGFFLDGIVDKFLRIEFLFRLFMAIVTGFTLGQQGKNQQ
jgi:hypothetical protein